MGLEYTSEQCTKCKHWFRVSNLRLDPFVCFNCEPTPLRNNENCVCCERVKKETTMPQTRINCCMCGQGFTEDYWSRHTRSNGKRICVLCMEEPQKVQQGSSITHAIAISPTERVIQAVCMDLADFLITKNRAYGNSALEPLRIFSTSTPEEQINVRIDDKLSRIARGDREAKAKIVEDTEGDLLGYLVLKRVQRRMPQQEPEPENPPYSTVSYRGDKKVVDPHHNI